MTVAMAMEQWRTVTQPNLKAGHILARKASRFSYPAIALEAALMSIFPLESRVPWLSLKSCPTNLL
jgi:hypothetical protein